MAIMFTLLNLLFNIAAGIIIGQVVMSWLIAFGIVNGSNAAARKLITFFHTVTDPIYAPLRRVIPSIGGIDITPLIVLIGLNLLQSLLFSLLAGAFL